MQALLKKIWGNEFYKGGVILTIASFLASFLNYLFNLFSARLLGPQGYGEITTLFSYLYILSAPTLVVSTLVAQKISASEKNSSLFAIQLETWFLTKFKKWFFLFIPLLLIAPFIPSLTNLQPITAYSIFPLVFFAFLFAFYTAAVQGLKMFGWLATVALVAALIKLTGPLLVMARIDGLNTIIVFFLFSQVLSIFFCKKILDLHLRNKILQTSKKLQKRTVDLLFSKTIFITTISLLSITLLNNADVIFVKKFLPETMAGIYGSWSLLAKIILFVLTPGISVLFIFFSSKSKTSHQQKTMLVSLLGLFLIGLGSYIAYAFFGSLLNGILFGSKFSAVVPFMGKAALFGSFYAGITLLNNYFLAKQSVFSLALTPCLLLYFIILFLVPKQINTVIDLNVIFSFIVFLIYLAFYFIYLRTQRAGVKP